MNVTPFYFVYYCIMLESLNKLSKFWKAVIGICGTLATIAGGIEGFIVIKGEIKDGIHEYAQPYIQQQVKLELEEQKKNKETSYRFKKAEAIGIPVDSVIALDKKMYINYLKTMYMLQEMVTIHEEREALRQYLKNLSLYIWKELDPYMYGNITLGYSDKTGLIFHKFEGYVFEAYHKGSTDSYWFKDSYGIERECK